MKSNEERLHAIFEKAAEKKRKRNMYLSTGAAAVVCLICTVSAVGVAVSHGDSVGEISISMDYSSATGGTINIGKFSVPVPTEPTKESAPTVSATGHRLPSESTDTVTQPQTTAPTQPVTAQMNPTAASVPPTALPTAASTEKPVFERPLATLPTVPTTETPKPPILPGCPAPTMPADADNNFVPVTDFPLNGADISDSGIGNGCIFDVSNAPESILPAKAYMVVSNGYFSIAAENLQAYDPDAQLNGSLGHVRSGVKLVFADALFKQMNGSADDIFRVRAYIVSEDHAEAARLFGLEADGECKILYCGACSLRQLADAIQSEDFPRESIVWITADAQNAE